MLPKVSLQCRISFHAVGKIGVESRCVSLLLCWDFSKLWRTVKIWPIVYIFARFKYPICLLATDFSLSQSPPNRIFFLILRKLVLWMSSDMLSSDYMVRLYYYLPFLLFVELNWTSPLTLKRTSRVLLIVANSKYTLT